MNDPAAFGRVALTRFAAHVAALRAAGLPPRDVPVSAYVINHNEPVKVDLALLSLARCDDVILLDKSSTDGSAEAAAGLATRLVRMPWTPVVEDTRAEADALCRHEWRIFLDADEFVSPPAIELLRQIAALDAAGDFPFDIVAIPRVNYMFGQAATRSIYKPWPLPRIHRRGAMVHSAGTHQVRLAEGARVLEVPDGCGAIHHLAQDNLWEYLEKMNRYTETYVTAYPSPRNAEEVFDFALTRLEAARISARRHNGSVYDAVCEAVTAVYYVTEYLKQWEASEGGSTDALYAGLSDILTRSEGNLSQDVAARLRARLADREGDACAA